MQISGNSMLVTGGASGLGRATAERLVADGAKVVIVDLPNSMGGEIASVLGSGARFVAADVTDEGQMIEAFKIAEGQGPLRAVVHCAGTGGGSFRLLDEEGIPAPLANFEMVVRVNLTGSFNVLRLAASYISKSGPIAGERGVIVLTSSIAAYEAQVGQLTYASSKAGVVGMTLVAARDLAERQIRVCTIAPGVFDTPMLKSVTDEVRTRLAKTALHPARLGQMPEFAMLAAHVIENPMLNGETIRLDGGARLAAG
jgi:NAD(P)-dependent dehydrogenase (short-subunit alcohol dehydrogenase family)